MQILGSESGKKGTRRILKIREAGQRQWVLKSAWYDTGNCDRDLYLGQIDVERQRRAAEAIERRYELSGRAKMLWAALRADPASFSSRDASRLRDELGGVLDRIRADLFDPARSKLAKAAQERTGAIVEALERHLFVTISKGE